MSEVDIENEDESNVLTSCVVPIRTERFRELMHEAIRSALRDGADEVQQNSAVQTREGWMHIHGASVHLLNPGRAG